MPGCASGSTLGMRGASEARDLGEPILRRVEHEVAVAARIDDGAQHRRERLRLLAVARDEHRLRLEQDAERAEPVGAERAPRGDEVDDRVGEPEPRRDLHRARDVDERHVCRQERLA